MCEITHEVGQKDPELISSPQENALLHTHLYQQPICTERQQHGGAIVEVADLFHAVDDRHVWVCYGVGFQRGCPRCDSKQAQTKSRQCQYATTKPLQLTCGLEGPGQTWSVFIPPQKVAVPSIPGVWRPTPEYDIASQLHSQHEGDHLSWAAVLLTVTGCASFLLCRSAHRTADACQGNVALTAVQQDNDEKVRS